MQLNMETFNLLSTIEKNEETIGEFTCDFCIMTFCTRAERNTHVMVHFEKKSCSNCKKILIRVADDWYEIHAVVNCSSVKCELELSIDEDEDDEQIFKSEKDHFVDTDQLTISNSMPNVNITAFSENLPNNDAQISMQPISSMITEEECNDVKDPMDTLENQPINKKKQRLKKKLPTNQAENSKSSRTVVRSKTYCNICNSFIWKAKFEIHLQRIHVPKIVVLKGPTKCDICGQTFSSPGNLKSHQYKHLETKRFVCSYCGHGFSQLHHLNEHINSHTGAKPHNCKVCNKSFGSLSQLRNHKLIHTGEKPCKCPIEGCDRAYAYAIDLKRHKYSMHGIYTKKHICPICSKVYPENKLLKKHLDSHSKDLS